MRKMALCFLLILSVLAFSSCTEQRGTDDDYSEETVHLGYGYNGADEPCMVQEPTDEPEPQQPYESMPEAAADIVTWHTSSHCLVPIKGVVTGFYGPVSDDGTVPWYVEWFEIEIQKEDGISAIIIGIHTTGFFFGSKPVPGMEIVAYVALDAPVFANDPPLYIATAIVAGFPPGFGVVTYCAYLGCVEPLSLRVTNDTVIVEMDFIGQHQISWESIRCYTTANSLAEWLSLNATCPYFQCLHEAIVYEATYDGLPVAKRIVRLSRDIPLPSWEEVSDQPVVLNFTDYSSLQVHLR